MKFIKYKQVARITFYGFDDLYRNKNSSVYTEPLKSDYFTNNLNAAGVQVGNNAKRMRFQIKGLDNVKLSEHARFCLESLKCPFLYDGNNEVKSLGQTIIRMSNLSSINCFDSHGNGQTDPVIFTGQTQTSQQRVGTSTTNVIYQNYELSQVFYNPYPEILYNFPISSNFLNKAINIQTNVGMVCFFFYFYIFLFWIIFYINKMFPFYLKLWCKIENTYLKNFFLIFLYLFFIF